MDIRTYAAAKQYTDNVTNNVANLVKEATSIKTEINTLQNEIYDDCALVRAEINFISESAQQINQNTADIDSLTDIFNCLQNSNITLNLENKYVSANGSIVTHEKYLLSNIIKIPSNCTLLYTTDSPITATIYSCERDGSNLVNIGTFAKDTELDFDKGYYRLNFRAATGIDITEESANIALTLISDSTKRISELEIRNEDINIRFDELKENTESGIGKLKTKEKEFTLNNINSGRTAPNAVIGSSHTISASDTWSYTEIKVSKGEEYTIHVRRTASSYARYIVALDENNIIIKNYIESSDIAELTKVNIVIPDNAVKLVISTYGADEETFKNNLLVNKIVPIALSEQINDHDGRISVLENDSALTFMSISEFNSCDTDMMNFKSAVVLY
ncbi:MAG: hypothetical protein K2F81_02480 [Ruminococcus sp.]|nr:hypothetical protein [Ruminococcus sp.]